MLIAYSRNYYFHSFYTFIFSGFVCNWPVCLLLSVVYLSRFLAQLFVTHVLYGSYFYRSLLPVCFFNLSFSIYPVYLHPLHTSLINSWIFSPQIVFPENDQHQRGNLAPTRYTCNSKTRAQG